MNMNASPQSNIQYVRAEFLYAIIYGCADEAPPHFDSVQAVFEFARREAYVPPATERTLRAQIRAIFFEVSNGVLDTATAKNRLVDLVTIAATDSAIDFPRQPAETIQMEKSRA